MLLSGNDSAVASGSVARDARATAAGTAVSSGSLLPSNSGKSTNRMQAPIRNAAGSSNAPQNKVAGTQLAAPLSPASVQSPELVAASEANPPGWSGPAPPERGKLARELFEATQQWLPTAPGDRYAIQLVTVSSEQLGLLEDFLLKASKMVPTGKLYIYSVKISGQQYYRVAYGSYATQAQALAAIEELPTPFSAYHPYYRSVERMRSQNRQ